MKKNALILIVPLIIFGCKTPQYLQQYTMNENQIIEGQGIDSFTIGKTSIDEVIQVLGKNYTKIKHKEYSVEYIYKELGLSFYHYQKKDDPIIFSIKIKSPFKGKTTKGIKLNSSTIRDAIEIYGKPDWRSCKDCDTWRIYYPGIEFSVERDTSLVHFPLDEAAHIPKKIIEISIKE